MVLPSWTTLGMFWDVPPIVLHPWCGKESVLWGVNPKPCSSQAVGARSNPWEEVLRIREGVEMPYGSGCFRWHLPESNCRSEIGNGERKCKSTQISSLHHWKLDFLWVEIKSEKLPAITPWSNIAPSSGHLEPTNSKFFPVFCRNKTVHIFWESWLVGPVLGAVSELRGHKFQRWTLFGPFLKASLLAEMLPGILHVNKNKRKKEKRNRKKKEGRKKRKEKEISKTKIY